VHIREESPYVLWIDAICINQKDKDEKIEQIRLLPKIFQHARRTLAFFGSDDRSHDAVRTLLQISHKCDSSRSWLEDLGNVPKRWRNLSMPAVNDPIWREIKCFFNRTWFQRAWIIQEAVAAPTVTIVCGKWKADWEDIALALDVIQREPNISDDITASWEPFALLSTLREREARGLQRLPLLRLLERFHYVESTLKPDRYFALLGLAEDGNRPEFEPEYDDTVAFSTLACRYGQVFVEQGNGIHLLRKAGIAGRKADDLDPLPSWLPDLTVRQNNRLLDLLDRGVACNASKGLQEHIEWHSSNKLVKVKGCFVDEIVQVSKHSNGQGPKQWIKYFEEIDAMVDDAHRDSRPDERHVLKVHVPIAGAMSLGEISIEDSYEAFRHRLKKSRWKSADKLKHDISKTGSSELDSMRGGVMTWQEKSMHYEELLRGNIAGWRFVVTERGHCGIVPSGVKTGDKVCIIGGGDVPFIIRRSVGAHQFQLVAGCYIHGMMRGEALKFLRTVTDLIPLV
jgi:hypothetical protein